MSHELSENAPKRCPEIIEILGSAFQCHLKDGHWGCHETEGKGTIKPEVGEFTTSKYELSWWDDE